MALSSNNPDYVTVGSATTSDHLALPAGYEYTLQCSSGGAYVVDLQVSTDNTNWSNVYAIDGTTKITLQNTAQQAVVVKGGASYRMNATTYNSTITMRARQS